jgi:predicted aspartyl protease
MKRNAKQLFLAVFVFMVFVLTNCMPKGGDAVKKELIQQMAKADVEYKSGDFDAAKLSYAKALEMSKNDSQALYGLGNIALFGNRPDDAIAFYNKALENAPWFAKIWPLDVEINYRISLSYYRKDDFENAAKYFNKAAGPIQAGPLSSLKGLKALVKQMDLFRGEKPYQIEGPKKDSIEFVITDPLPVIKVSINNSEPVNFFIDTGAAEVILDRQYAEKIGADISGSMLSSYAGSKQAKTGLGKVGSVSVSGITVKNVPVHTLDVEALAPIFGKTKVYGCIGTRFLMHFKSTIDYKNGALILENIDEKKVSAAAEREKSIPFWLAEMHFMLARGSVNNSGPVLLFVDTGLADAGFTSSEALLKKYGINADWSKAGDAVGGAGAVKAVEIIVERLTLGADANEIICNQVPGRAIEGGTPVVGDMLGFHVGGLISHQFFRKYAVTFDFQDMRMIIKP